MSELLLNANALKIPLVAESMDMCVTSPPYFGLRDYQVSGQLGLEETPEAYVANMVAVFREVWRVMKPEGTLWLNIGDSYNTAPAGNKTPSGLQQTSTAGRAWAYAQHTQMNRAKDRTTKRWGGGKNKVAGLKPKDLIGIPWSLAKALQAPYYTGSIKNELDRVWMAATIDGEGTIAATRHLRKDDGSVRTSGFIYITNTSIPLIEHAQAIYPSSTYTHQEAGEGHLGTREVYRWSVTSAKQKSLFLAEIYPYLIVKRKQALLGWNLFEYTKQGQLLGKSKQAQEVRDKRALLVEYIQRLNQGGEVDIPSWAKEPTSFYEPGWYLRSDIIWAKPNPMPESVTDRPTKSHEYIFLLAKQRDYYYDHEAIKEPVAESSIERMEYGWNSDRPGAKVGPNGIHTERMGERFVKPLAKNLQKDGQSPNTFFQSRALGIPDKIYYGRNKRSVWTVTTKPYKGAHFATFPPDLIEPCIKAGCPPGGVVLDPFVGSGTTAWVARKLGRSAVGLDLSFKYLHQQARERLGWQEERLL